METVKGFDFFRLHFDANGVLENTAEFEELGQRARISGASDAILIAHGFRNDENDAMGLYTDFLDTFRGHIEGGLLPPLANAKFVVAGVFWPSKKFEESFESDGAVEALDPETAEKIEIIAKLEDLKATVATAEQKPQLDRAIHLLDQVQESESAQDEFVNCVRSLLGPTDLDSTEGLDLLLAADGSSLLKRLGNSSQVAAADDPDDQGGVLAVDSDAGSMIQDGGVEGLGALFGSIFGRIGQFLNFTTWYTMKARSGRVGATGVAKAVRDLNGSVDDHHLRIHLVGHSLGGRLMAGCAKALGDEPKVHPDSLTLLEAAFSHYGFSPNNNPSGGRGQAGFFRSVVADQVVNGPFISTFSAQDSVVGKIYAIASRLVDDTINAVGDRNDKFGGIGRNGAQLTSEAESELLHPVGTPYQFQQKKIQCLDGSNGLIKDHGDVRNTVVTYAFASVVAATQPVAMLVSK